MGFLKNFTSFFPLQMRQQAITNAIGVHFVKFLAMGPELAFVKDVNGLVRPTATILFFSVLLLLLLVGVVSLKNKNKIRRFGAHKCFHSRPTELRDNQYLLKTSKSVWQNDGMDALQWETWREKWVQ